MGHPDQSMLYAWFKVGMKVSRMTWADLGHLGHFLVGHVGLIRKLNKYLNVTWISHVC